MDLRHLETFRAVVRHGSLLRAADALGCAQSTVTLHVQQLEADLGARLFERHGRGVRLTAAGEVLRERADDLLERVARLADAVADLGAGRGGHLRLGAIEPTASLRLPALLAPFCRRRPNLRLTLEVGGTRALAERVAGGDLDAALCSPPAAALGLGFEPLFVEPLGVLVPDRHPLAALGAVSAGDLRGERLLLTEPGCAYRELVERTLVRGGVVPESRLEIASVRALKRYVQRGLGVAVAPVAEARPPLPGTVLLGFAGRVMALPVGIARRRDEPAVNPALAEVLASFRARLVRADEALVEPPAGA